MDGCRRPQAAIVFLGSEPRLQKSIHDAQVRLRMTPGLKRAKGPASHRQRNEQLVGQMRSDRHAGGDVLARLRRYVGGYVLGCDAVLAQLSSNGCDVLVVQRQHVAGAAFICHCFDGGSIHVERQVLRQRLDL